MRYSIEEKTKIYKEYINCNYNAAKVARKPDTPSVSTIRKWAKDGKWNSKDHCEFKSNGLLDATTDRGIADGIVITNNDMRELLINKDIADARHTVNRIYNANTLLIQDVTQDKELYYTKKEFYKNITEKAAKHNISVQVIYEQLINLMESSHVNNIRVAYQSLENYDINNTNLNTNKFTKLAFGVDQTREESGECVCIQREHKNDTSIDKPIQMTKKTETLQLHDILHHIAAQSMLTNTEATIKPSIIVLGECGEHLFFDTTKSDYIPIYLEHNNIQQAYEKMCCFVLKEFTKDFKISSLELNNKNARPGFLIEWKSWKLCFIHLPNKDATNMKAVNQYLNGLLGSDKNKVNLVAGDFNTSLKTIQNSTGNNFNVSSYDQKSSFTDKKLSKVNGTNSVHNKVFDGFLANSDTVYERGVKYITQDYEERYDTLHNVIPLGLISRTICNSKNAGQTYTDHEGFAFDIAASYTTNITKQENEILDKILWYKSLIDLCNSNVVADSNLHDDILDNDVQNIGLCNDIV